MTYYDATSAQHLIDLALHEDLGHVGDVTSDCLWDESVQGHAVLHAKSNGVWCGADLFRQVFHTLDAKLNVQLSALDGKHFKAGDILADMHGSLGAILKGERTALNFAGHLCGIATLTRQFVDRIAHTHTRILDTRKTLPGYRALEKMAVHCGGGLNHRMGLHDAVLVKENHIAGFKGTLSELVQMYRIKRPDLTIEVEVETLAQLQELIPGQPNRVLLDHFSLEDMRSAVALCRLAGIQVEASGNMTLDRIAAVAETGVDFISVGALTHSAPVSDLSLQIKTNLENTELSI